MNEHRGSKERRLAADENPGFERISPKATRLAPSDSIQPVYARTTKRMYALRHSHRPRAGRA